MTPLPALPDFCSRIDLPPVPPWDTPGGARRGLASGTSREPVRNRWGERGNRWPLGELTRGPGVEGVNGSPGALHLRKGVNGSDTGKPLYPCAFPRGCVALRNGEPFHGERKRPLQPGTVPPPFPKKVPPRDRGHRPPGPHTRPPITPRARFPNRAPRVHGVPPWHPSGVGRKLGTWRECLPA